MPPGTAAPQCGVVPTNTSRIHALVRLTPHWGTAVPGRNPDAPPDSTSLISGERRCLSRPTCPSDRPSAAVIVSEPGRRRPRDGLDQSPVVDQQAQHTRFLNASAPRVDLMGQRELLG